MTAGFEDSMFSFGHMRRQRILEIFRGYDVDPNMAPNGQSVVGQLERFVNDPSIRFDDIRRTARAVANNGFTNTQLAEMYPHNLPITMSDPMNQVDRNFSADGEQTFGDPDDDYNPFDQDDAIVDPYEDSEVLFRAPGGGEDEIVDDEQDPTQMIDGVLDPTQPPIDPTDPSAEVVNTDTPPVDEGVVE